MSMIFIFVVVGKTIIITYYEENTFNRTFIFIGVCVGQWIGPINLTTIRKQFSSQYVSIPHFSLFEDGHQKVQDRENPSIIKS